MTFEKGAIDGVLVTPGRKFIDERGWLMETFRHDELERTIHPVMGYTSQTLPGFKRGPHEHVEQTDLFIFMGPGNFKIWLWDNRKQSPTYRRKQVLFGGEDYPLKLVVPPGVVHAYKNISSTPSLVHNYPNQLYMGQGRKSPIDEIRHEDDPATLFQCD